MVLSFIVFAVFSCAPEEKTPKAGAADTEDMLEMLPAEAQGVFFVNVKDVMAIEAMDETLKKDENYKKYQEFIQETGIDPEKDVFYVAAALLPGDEETKQKGVGIINLKYDPDVLMDLIKEKSAEEGTSIQETDYSGQTIYNMKPEESEEEVEIEEEEEEEFTETEGAFTFLDSSNIAVGNESSIKSVIDVIKNNKDNIYKNQQVTKLLEKTDRDTMFWGAVNIPSEAVEEAAAQNPMLQNLSSVHAVTMNFDYKKQNISAMIKLMSTDPEKNSQIANALNGFKSMGQMAAQENPAIGELMNKITIESDEEMVKISADIPEELIDKLKKESPGEEKETEEKK